MLVVKIIIIAFWIILIVGGFTIETRVLIQEKKKNKERTEDLQLMVDDLVRANNEFQQKIINKDNDLIAAQQTITSTHAALNEAQRHLDLNTKVEDVVAQYNNYLQINATEQDKYDRLNAQFNEQTALYNELLASVKNAQLAYNELESNLLVMKAKNEAEESQFRRLSAQNRAATQRLIENDDATKNSAATIKLSFNFDDKTHDLLNIIRKLQNDHPEYKVEFGKFIWTHIFMPQIQNWNKVYKLDSLCGIYRLSDRANESRTYVGQAVNIKERWYTHIKKLCGAEIYGGEKLYNVSLTPDNLYWEIVEEVEDRGLLNSSEAKWIEFYGADLSLNSKKGTTPPYPLDSSHKI